MAVLLLDEPLLWYPIGNDQARTLLRERREQAWRWAENPANICADLGHLHAWGSGGGVSWGPTDCLRCGAKP